MMFKSNDQRKAMFANMNRFSSANASVINGVDRVGVAMMAKSGSSDEINRVANSKDYAVCKKYDGIRIWAVGRGGEVEIFNPRKGGEDLSHKFPEVISLINSKMAGMEPFIIDGEIISSKHDKNDFHNVVARLNTDDADEIKRKVSDVPVSLVLFDVIELGDRDLTGVSYAARHELLEDIVGHSDKNIYVEECTNVNKMNFANDYISAGGEGVIFKRLDSNYQKGKRSDDWLKYKKDEVDTFIVYGAERGSGSNSTMAGSLLIGKLEGGKLVSVGKVGSGLSKDDRAYIWKKLDGGNQDYVTLPKDKWFGVDVKYMEEDVDGGLRQPRVERLREDIGVGAIAKDNIGVEI